MCNRREGDSRWKIVSRSKGLMVGILVVVWVWVYGEWARQYLGGRERRGKARLGEGKAKKDGPVTFAVKFGAQPNAKRRPHSLATATASWVRHEPRPTTHDPRPNESRPRALPYEHGSRTCPIHTHSRLMTGLFSIGKLGAPTAPLDRLFRQSHTHELAVFAVIIIVSYSSRVIPLLTHSHPHPHIHHTPLLIHRTLSQTHCFFSHYNLFLLSSQ